MIPRRERNKMRGVDEISTLGDSKIAQLNLIVKYVADIYDVGNVNEAYARHMHPGCDRSSGGRGRKL
jgi:hypothetical protein